MLWTECETNPTFQNTPAHHKLTALPAADSNCSRCWRKTAVLAMGKRGWYSQLGVLPEILFPLKEDAWQILEEKFQRDGDV